MSVDELEGVNHFVTPTAWLCAAHRTLWSTRSSQILKCSPCLSLSPKLSIKGVRTLNVTFGSRGSPGEEPATG
jgi:hypothetical protein